MRNLLLAIVLLPFTVIAQKDYTRLVNPFIGTGGHGHTYPGASMPFGMMQLSPDTRMADWDGSGGYHYSDSVIYGFSHTHLSGTGIPDYCDVLLMPFTGSVQWNKEDYRSPFSHKNEKASPGYYEVLLDKSGIRAQLTTSIRSGMHQYTFPADAKDASVLIDLKHRDEVLESYIEKVNDHELRGFRRSKSWARNQYLYFHIVFDQPIQSLYTNQTGYQPQLVKLEGKDIKVAVNFKTPANHTIKVKLGISAVSADGAAENVRTEIKDWNFNALRQKATAAWNKELGKISVKGGTHDQQVSFYTALYHTFLVPNIFQDVNGQYRGTDNEIHTAKGFTNYSVFSLWDTYRAYHPLMTIINQQRTKDWVNTFLNQYRNGGMLPVWELAANETFCMIGYHSVPVITDAWQKGIINTNGGALLNAMTSYAESHRYGLPDYRQLGYISNDREHESVSKTLEYAYDDWCIAQFARMIGRDSVYRNYMQRAQYYKNVFDPATKHMRGRAQSMWYTPFDAKEINNFFTEGNAWQYSFAVPQDVNGLIQLYGGNDAFAAKLDELFTTSSATTGREQPDVTGLIGQYAQGNEPSHHMAYLYNFAGQPWKTQALVHRINQEFYKNDPDGLIGNEDCGQMSAWFVLSAMGFYPVCPGNGEYVLGTPLFDEVSIQLENGKSFTIRARRNTADAYYVQRTSLNNRTHINSYVLHSDVMKGGVLEFQLGNRPNMQWASKANQLPHSSITGNAIVAAPFIDAASNKFRKQATIRFQSVDSNVTYWYNISGNASPGAFTHYTTPFTIDSSCYVHYYAVNTSGNKSKTVSQQFYRVPEDRTIQVLSKVHPMYTAGGPEALIDGIEGSTNWRAGEWQSYFDSDLDAVIDLQNKKQISFLGVHVLQDVSPWILYPKEVIFYTSDNGTDYTEATRVSNTAAQQMDTVVTQTLGKAVNLACRYIKVKVVNGGKLPEWHESAGNPSHLFIDEIVIR